MFNTKINLYGLMIILALIINIIIVLIIAKKYHFSKEEITGAIVYENIGIMLGAKLLTYIQNYKVYGKFSFFSLGLSSYGAVLGALIFLFLFSLQFNKSLKEMLFTFLPSIPLMYAIGKIGCFLTGCCYGIYYHGFGHIIYKYSQVAPNNTSLFPVQILETICFLFIFIYMIRKTIQNKFTYQTLGISFILCGLAKFILDYFRFSHINEFISLNQGISLIFIFIGLIIYLRNRFYNSFKE